MSATMNAARHRELQASLRRELDRRALEHNLTPTGRVVWLLDQIENYIERWLAFGTSGAQTMAPADDLFRMIEIGAEVTSTEMQAAGSPALAERWLEFLSVLESARAGIQPHRLTDSLAVVRSALCS